MNVILSHPHDQDAIWLYLSLKQQDIPIEMVSPEELLMAAEWKQQLTNENDGFFIKTKKGLELTDTNLNFVFNRSQLATSPIWGKADEIEQQYIQAEMNALMMSWLYQVKQKSPLYNPPVGYSLSGVYWSMEQWEKAAYMSGFDVFKNIEEQATVPTKRILVIGKEVLTDSTSQKLIKCSLELSKQAQTPLLEIIVSTDDSQFISANTYPSFKAYGQQFITIIKRLIYEN